MCYGISLYTYYVLIVFFSVSLSFVNGNFHYSGQKVETTHDEVWPKPMLQNYYGGYLTLEPLTFQFKVRSNMF